MQSKVNEEILYTDISDMLNGVGRLVMYIVHKNKVGNPMYREVIAMYEGKL